VDTAAVDTAVNAAVQELIERQVAEGSQIGVQVAAHHRGVPVVDAVAGRMGPHDGRPVRSDTLFCSFSTTKGVTALAVHQLIDRGLIDPEAPVARYWPAFAAHGKSRITVAQAMSHQAGLHALPRPFRPHHLTDWDAALARIEQATPAWEPGTATGYHAVTYGWLAGGIVQHATGRRIEEVIRSEIAVPLGLADEVFLGVPVQDPSIRERLATLLLVPAGQGLPIADDAPFYEAMPRPMWPYFNDLVLREAVMPGANGHFTARALSRIYGALANGGEIDGVRIIGADALARANTILTSQVDRVLMAPIRKGIGFFMGGPGPHPDGRMVPGAMGPRETAFGHPGAGGSIAFADPEVGLSIAVTINQMAFPLPGEGTTVAICDLVRAQLGAD
jgi:CubicO group peptidase (beta-lactamase class C family)